MNQITILLDALGRGEERAAEELMPLVYKELRRMAAAHMARQLPGHTLQPTELVHEAWLRQVGGTERGWKDRAHFFAAAATAMRHILVDHARRKTAAKHGGNQKRMDIENVDQAETQPDEMVLLIDDALAQLEKEFPERGRVVVLKYFGGMTNREIAELVGMSERTVNRHWLCAKSWLFHKIQAQK